METKVIGTDLDNRYWFHARAIGFREAYRDFSTIPWWLNPWAVRAQLRVRRFSLTWDVRATDKGMIVDLFHQETETRETGGQYERILKYLVCVVAKTRAQARIRVQACLDHGPFVEYAVEKTDAAEVAAIENTPAATRAIADQTAVHPLIGGEYTPSVPEIHLADSLDDMASVIRIELSESQLRRQITRIQQYRRRVYGKGQFSIEFQLDAQTNERMLAILATVAAEDEGVLVASVSLTNDDPDVAVTLVLSQDEVDEIQERAKERRLASGEVARWRYPLAEEELDEFYDNAQTAIDTASPGIVGKNLFAEETETNSGAKINA